jgi:hypothetical protein
MHISRLLRRALDKLREEAEGGPAAEVHADEERAAA